MCLNYWSPSALARVRRKYWASLLQLLKPMGLETMLRKKRSQRSEKPVHVNRE